MNNKILKSSILAVAIFGSAATASALVNMNDSYMSVQQQNSTDIIDYDIDRGITLEWNQKLQEFTISIDATVTEATRTAPLQVNYVVGEGDKTLTHDFGTYIDAATGNYYRTYSIDELLTDYDKNGLSELSKDTLEVSWDITTTGTFTALDTGGTSSSYNELYGTTDNNKLTFTKAADDTYEIDASVFIADEANIYSEGSYGDLPSFSSASIYQGTGGSSNEDLKIKLNDFNTGDMDGDPTFILNGKVDDEPMAPLPADEWVDYYQEVYFTLPTPGTYTDLVLTMSGKYIAADGESTDFSFDTDVTDESWVVVETGNTVDENFDLVVSDNGDMSVKITGSPVPEHALYWDIFTESDPSKYEPQGTYAFTYLDETDTTNGVYEGTENIDNFGSYSDDSGNTYIEPGTYYFDFLMRSSSLTEGYWSQQHELTSEQREFTVNEDRTITFNDNFVGDVTYEESAGEASEVSMKVNTYQEIGGKATAVVDITSDVDIDTLEMKYDGSVISAAKKDETRSTSSWTLTGIPIDAKDNLGDVEVYINGAKDSISFNEVTNSAGDVLYNGKDGMAWWAILLIVIASLTVIGIIGLVIYILFAGKKDKDSNDKNVEAA